MFFVKTADLTYQLTHCIHPDVSDSGELRRSTTIYLSKRPERREDGRAKRREWEEEERE